MAPSIVLEAENGAFDLSRLPDDPPLSHSPRKKPPTVTGASHRKAPEPEEDDEWVKVSKDECYGPEEVTAARLKDEGNERFRGGDYEGATAKYTEALAQAGEDSDASAFRAAVYANRAAAHAKMGDNVAVVADCGSCLKIDRVYTKALVRRAAALEQLGHRREAIADLQAALDLEPALPRVKASLKRLKDQLASE